MQKTICTKEEKYFACVARYKLENTFKNASLFIDHTGERFAEYVIKCHH